MQPHLSPEFRNIYKKKDNAIGIGTMLFGNHQLFHDNVIINSTIAEDSKLKSAFQDNILSIQHLKFMKHKQSTILSECTIEDRDNFNKEIALLEIDEIKERKLEISIENELKRKITILENEVKTLQQSPHKKRKWSTESKRVSTYKRMQVLLASLPEDQLEINEEYMTLKQIREIGDIEFQKIRTTVTNNSNEQQHQQHQQHQQQQQQQQQQATTIVPVRETDVDTKKAFEPTLINDPHFQPFVFREIYDTCFVYCRITEDKGVGVFAIKFIPKNTLITEYFGNVIYTEDNDSYIPNKYKTHWRKNEVLVTCIAGITRPIKGCGVGSLCNSSQNSNADFYKVTKHPFKTYIKARFDINPDEEITLSYKWFTV